MPPVMSESTPQTETLEGDRPDEEADPADRAVALSQSPVVREEVETQEDVFLPLMKFARMQVLSCIVQLETKSFIECTNKGCLYIALTVWDMAYHLAKCEGIKGNCGLKKCRYCPKGALNVDVLNNHMILSHSYAPEVLDNKNKLEFKDLRQEEREAFLISPVARGIIRSHWRISYQTKGYIICLTQTCRFVTSLIPVMEDHYIRCSPQIWENLKFSCEKCLGRTTSEEALETHIEECHSAQNLTFNTVQPEAKRFWELSLVLYGVSKCVSLHCKFVASNLNELERHYRYCRVPHVENYVVCEYCGGWLDTNDDRIQHIVALHSHVKSSPDESIEALKACEHLDVVKKLVNLDLNSATFPWIKVMSFGGEAVLNRVVEGLGETTPCVRILKSKKKKKKLAQTKLEVEPSPTKVVTIKREKPDTKRHVLIRRSRPSETDSDISLHAIKAEELFIPDKTFLEDLGQAIEVECKETPKVEFEVSVGDQSWKVEAPDLETASEVVTRKMPSYSMKGVLAQSIEDSLNLLKIEARVSSIENMRTKPYAPPKMLSFANKPSVLESLKKKFDLVRQRAEKEKCEDSFMTGDSFTGAQEIEVTPTETPKKKPKRKEFRPGVRPWQSLARIKQKPVPEPESDDEDSPSEGDFADISVSKRINESAPSKSRCKILLPKRKEPTKSVQSRDDNDATSDKDKKGAHEGATVASKSGKTFVTTAYRKRSCQLQKCDDDSVKLVRDVSLQHGSSALPVLSEQLINSRYHRAALVIGYPYTNLKHEHAPISADTSTQTVTRNYSCRPQTLNPKLPASKTVPNNQLSQPVVVTSPSFNVPRLPGSLQGQKKLVVIRRMAPVDMSNPTGARILKETRIIGDLKQTVVKNLSRIGANGALGAPQIVRFVTGPISRVNPGSSAVPFRIPTSLVRCSPPTIAVKEGSKIMTLPAACVVTAASNVKPSVSSKYVAKVPSICNARSTTIPVPTPVVKTEPLDPVSFEDPNYTSIVPSTVCTSSVVSSDAASPPSVLSSNAAPSASVVFPSAAPPASTVFSRAAPTTSTVSASAAAASTVTSSAALTAPVVSSCTAPSASDTPNLPPIAAAPLLASSYIPSSAPSNLTDFPSNAGFGDSNATSRDRPSVTGAPSCEMSAMPPVSGGISNAVSAFTSSPSTTHDSSFNWTPNLKTYSNSSKRTSMLQTAKKPRLEIPSRSEGCSKDISLPEEDVVSPIPFDVSLVKSALLQEVNRSDNFCERKVEQSRLNDSDFTSKPSVRLSCSTFEELAYSCCSGNHLEDDSVAKDQYGIFDEGYFDGCQCATAKDEMEAKPSTSKDYNDVRNHKFDGSDPAIFSSVSKPSGNCDSLDPSIPFEVLCDSSTAARGGLYNETCPWEARKQNMLPSIEKPTQSDIPETASQQTSIQMEVDENPAPRPQLKEEHAEAFSVKDEVVENGGDGCNQNANNVGEQVNELVTYLTNHDDLQMRNEPMVYVLNKILLERNSSAHQNNPRSKSLSDNDEQRSNELVHYLTNYNRFQVTNDPIVCIATRNVPSTSRNSDKGPQGSGKGRRSLQSKSEDARKSEKTAIAENSNVLQNVGDKGVEVPSKKRQRKSAPANSADASNPENQNESAALTNSSSPKQQELSTQAPTKKRGRKSKVDQEEFASTDEDVSRALANTKLDDASENGQGGSKTLPPKKPGRKSKKSVAAENENESLVKRLQGSSNKDDPESKSERMDRSVEKAEVEKPKASGKKAKNSTVKVADCLLEMEVEPGDDDNVPQTSAARPRRALPKKSLEPVEMEEDAFGDPVKPKKRGRPPKVVEEPIPKQPEDDNGKMFLYHDDDADIDNGDRNVPQTSAGRSKRAVSKKSVEQVEMEEDVSGDDGMPNKPRKRGRPPKAVEDPILKQPEDDSGKIFLYHENDADSDDGDGGLVPAYDRIVFNSTLPNPNKLVTCAICNDNMTAKVYKTTHLYKHNHVCWLKNEEPMDLNDELALERHLYKVYCRLRKPFYCEVCGKAVKSARGFISHTKFCGKTMEERRGKMVACTVCSRLLKPSSLSQHIQNHHSQTAHPSPVKEEPVDLPPRAAASKLKQLLLSSPAGGEAPGPVHIDEDEERAEADSQPWIRRNYHLEKRRITPTIKAIFSEHIAKDGVARCLNLGCDKSDGNVKNVMDHYKTCDKISLDFKCKFCSYLEGNEYVMIHHVRTVHGDKANELKGRNIPGVDLPFELPEFSGKCLPYLKAAEAASRSLLFLQPALFWTYKMKIDFVASGCIFPELSVDSSTTRTFEDHESYLELRDESMRIALNDNSPEWMMLTKLTSFRATDDMVIMYTGGVVRSLDWFPSEREQYLIVAVGSIGPNSINVRSTKTGPRHLQIWSAGQLNNFASPLDLPLKFEFALCHDFGEVWDLQCCPGGQPDAERLGLVALATSSGKVVVYAVPSILSLVLDGSHRATKPDPTLVLETGLHESYQVSKVAWSKVKPHRFIAGGFTNGMVAVWDLATTSILLRTGNTILPFKMFHPHFITITGLSFSPVHEYFIVTACADKSSKFFNLEDTSISHVEFSRGLFMDVAWLHHWMSVVAGIDDNTTLGTTTAMIHPLRNFIYQAHPSVTQAESCCLSVSVNDWMNAFVCSYDSGQVLLTFARKHCHMMDDRKRGHAQLITPEFHNFNPTSEEMTDCQSYATTSEKFGIIFNSDFSAAPTTKLKPVPFSDLTHFPSTAANKVCFNPNVNSFLTLAVGYHSGFVTLGRLKLQPTELADLSLVMSELHKNDQPAPSGFPCQAGTSGT